MSQSLHEYQRVPVEHRKNIDISEFKFNVYLEPS